VNRRPVIGVTGPYRGGAAAWIMTSAAIVRAGGRPLRVTPSRPRRGALLDGLVIGGGADIDPALYLEEEESFGEAVRVAGAARRELRAAPSPRFWSPALLFLRRALARSELAGVDRARDDLERRLLDDAFAHDWPVLGICRGAQLMNVHLGGTLYADVREFYAETPHISTLLPRRWVEVDPASVLARTVGATRLLVNALHHQAVKSVGRGLSVTARDGGGIVQAIEESRHRYRLGVQWHPEYIPHHPRQRALFRALVSAARG
jgi:putative glutamine amidotransferase